MTQFDINVVSQIIFYCFAVMSVGCACMVVFGRNPVRSVLFLVLTFFATGAVWIMLQAEFLGLILIVVYVGAVMTMFLFVVMMLDLDIISKFKGLVRYYPLVLLLAGLLLALIIMFVGPWHFDLKHFPLPAALPKDYSSTKALGGVLYTDFLLPFELAGVVLLLGMIAAIGLTKGGMKKKFSRKQNVGEQLATRPQDRLRLVKDEDLDK